MNRWIPGRCIAREAERNILINTPAVLNAAWAARLDFGISATMGNMFIIAFQDIDLVEAEQPRGESSRNHEDDVGGRVVDRGQRRGRRRNSNVLATAILDGGKW